MGDMGQKAQEAKENTKGAAHSANQKAQEKSGQTKEKASEIGQSTKEAAQGATEAAHYTSMDSGVGIRNVYSNINLRQNWFAL
ncbi:hypothetical protein JHK87_021906 [Glycine soja]|nr:hypothetical protein JHK87_021906 [Glycine soja]